MKTRTTIFDSRISAIADILNAAVNTDVEHQIPERYIGYFCELVVNSMWRSVSNAIAGMELYGDVVGFIFNMGGYIDTMHDIDKVRWHGFSDKQADELDRCYAKVVQIFREIALDIIEMHLRCMVPYDIELAVKYMVKTEASWNIPQYGAYRLGVSRWQADSRGNLRYFLESGKKVNAL